MEEFSKAMPFLDKAVNVLEGYSDRTNSDLVGMLYYKTLRLDRAIAYISLKRYKQAEKGLEWLSSTYPDDGTVKVWLAELKNNKLKKLQKVLLAVMAVALLFSFTVVDGGIYDHILTTVIAIGLVGSFAVDLIKRKNKKVAK
jgi:CRISPR/Cas system-associated endonuclease Cas3-HD